MGSGKRRPARVDMIRKAVKKRTQMIRDSRRYRAALRRIADGDGRHDWNECDCGEIAEAALGEDDE